MVKSLKFIKVLKDTLVRVKGWKKLDDPDFKNKLVVFLSTKGFDDVLSKYPKLSDVSDSIELEYVISRNFVSYKIDSTMFELKENDLLNIADKNGFFKINLPKGISNDNYMFLLRNLSEVGCKIIPLDTMFLVDEEIEFEFEKLTLRSKKIVDEIIELD